MKNKFLTVIIYFIYGILISVGPHEWFKVCTTEASVMKCYWTSRAEIGVGVLFVILALLTLIGKDKQDQIWISIFGFAATVLALAFPLYLIGGCVNSKMPCRTTAFPVIYILSGLVLLYIVGNITYLFNKLKKAHGDKKNEEKE